MTAHTVWPTERWPTADEWREWFLSLDPPAQHDVADKVITNAQTATRCHNQDHDTAYNRGWRDGSAGRKEARREYTEEHSR